MTRDDRLDNAIRAALRDLVEAAPTRDDVPVRAGGLRGVHRSWRRPLLATAVGLTAAAGIVAVVAVTTRDPITTDVAQQSMPATPATALAPSPPPTPHRTTSATSTSTSAPSTSTTAAVVPATDEVTPVPGPPQRVLFPSGTNNTSIVNETSPERTDRYLLTADAGQTMVVHLESADPNATFSVVAPDGTRLVEDEMLADVDLPTDGDYLIEVETTGSGGNYTITFLIN